MLHEQVERLVGKEVTLDSPGLISSTHSHEKGICTLSSPGLTISDQEQHGSLPSNSHFILSWFLFTAKQKESPYAAFQSPILQGHLLKYTRNQSCVDPYLCLCDKKLSDYRSSSSFGPALEDMACCVF